MANFNELIRSDIPLLVDFYADWCQPCKAMPPILKEVKAKWGDRVRIIKINVDSNQPVARKYAIQSIPTLMLFQQGNTIWRQAGVVPADQINRKLQSVL